MRIAPDGTAIIRCSKDHHELSQAECQKCLLYSRCPYDIDFLSLKEKRRLEREIREKQRRGLQLNFYA